MNAIEQTGKVASSVVESMRSVPLAIALLVVNGAFIAFFAYLLHEVSVNARERNVAQSDLINTLVKECTLRKPSIMFRSSKTRGG